MLEKTILNNVLYGIGLGFMITYALLEKTRIRPVEFLMIGGSIIFIASILKLKDKYNRVAKSEKAKKRSGQDEVEL